MRRERSWQTISGSLMRSFSAALSRAVLTASMIAASGEMPHGIPVAAQQRDDGAHDISFQFQQ
jgi:hypothetical protein